MKNVWLMGLLVVGVLTSALAQTEKGGHLIGTQVGNIYIPTSGGSGSIISLQPAYGWFVGNGLALGIGVPFLHISSGGTGVTQIGLTPFLRYYIGSATVKPFLGGSFGVVNSSVSGYISYPSSTDVIYGLTGGIAFFLNKAVSFDASLNYAGGNTSNAGGILGGASPLTPSLPDAVTINLGFQVYFGKK